MKKMTMFILGAKALRLAGGSLRLTMGGLGAILAAFLLRERYRKKSPK
jgi:hypothetical protein